MRRDEMDAIIERHYAAEEAKDLEAIVATLTEDVEHDVVGDPAGVTSDPAVIKQRYAQLFADLGDEVATPVRRLYGEDFLVDETLVTAKAVGQPLGIPGLGRPISFRLLHVCEFRDGRISRENVWMDVAAIVAQLSGPDRGPAESELRTDPVSTP